VGLVLCTVNITVGVRTESLELRVIQDEKRDLVTDCHSILAGRRTRFSKLLTVRGINGVRQKYTQQNQQCLTRVPLRLGWLLKR